MLFYIITMELEHTKGMKKKLSIQVVDAIETLLQQSMEFPWKVIKG